MSRSDLDFMEMALGLARRGLGRTWPNPAVGCVIVKSGRVIGRGWTQPSGRPHAEVVALKQAGADADGSTAYVTLEPCAHHGRTPPCADALIAARVSRVVIACGDPDPRVDGGGVDRLHAAGIAVDEGLCEDNAIALNIGFLTRVQQGRPAVTLKLASSFDGRIATASGESQWITGPAARRHVHSLRARHDAVLVGAGTARADDPSLTVRDLGVAQQPVRLVWSRNLDLPLTGKLARTAGDVPVWLCCAQNVDPALRAAWEGLGARLLDVPVGRGGQIEPLGALKALGAAGLTRVFCEGGGALAASLLASDAVDHLAGYTAGAVIGAEGWPSVGAMGLERLSEAPRFELVERQVLGDDLFHLWRRGSAV